VRWALERSDTAAAVLDEEAAVTWLDGPDDRRWLRAPSPGCVVFFDSPRATDALRSWARELAAVAAIDDHGHGTFTVDLLVDPDAVTRRDQVVPDSAAVLVGPAHALLHRSFRDLRRPRTVDERAPAVVALGGGDPPAFAEEVVAQAEAWPGGCRIILGPQARTVATTAEVVRTPPRVADELDGAGVVVSGGGMTMWEAIAMGHHPVCVQTAADQAQAIEVAAAAGAIWPSAPDAVTTSLAAAVADPARPPSPLVDGLGAHRVADALAALAARAVRRA
jgi:hypothetical protein